MAFAQFFAFVPDSMYDARAAGVPAMAERALDALGESAPRSRFASGRGFTVLRAGAGSRPAAIATSARLELCAVGTWFLGDRFASGDEADLLAEIEARGIDAVVADLEGLFAIVVLDRASGALELITDCAGSCHAFFSRLSDGWAVASSSLLLGTLAGAGLDPVALRSFVATGIVFGQRSLWRGVTKTLPASILRLRPGAEPEDRRYWGFDRIRPEHRDEIEAADAIAAAMSAAARRITRRFPRTLCDLTGGYDSRATIAGFLDAGVSFETTVSGTESSADARVAAEIARAFGLRHTRIAPTWQPSLEGLDEALRLTDGEYDLVEYSRIARTHRGHSAAHDVSVNGSFGELARGYWWELLFPRIGAREKLDAAMLTRRRFAAAGYDGSLFSGEARFDLVEVLAADVDRANAALAGFPNTTQMDHAYYAMRMQRWQGRIASSTNRIWPCLSPYAFRSVLEPVLETKACARSRSLVVRTMLERRLPKLANMPLEHGYPAVPARLSNVHRFWPVLAHYAGRVAEKVRARIGLQQPPQAAAAAPHSAMLLADERLQDSAKFERLKGSGLFDPASLERIRSEAAAPGFGRDTEWCRLMTLERLLERRVGADAGIRDGAA